MLKSWKVGHSSRRKERMAILITYQRLWCYRFYSWGILTSFFVNHVLQGVTVSLACLSKFPLQISHSTALEISTSSWYVLSVTSLTFCTFSALRQNEKHLSKKVPATRWGTQGPSASCLSGALCWVLNVSYWKWTIRACEITQFLKPLATKILPNDSFQY